MAVHFAVCPFYKYNTDCILTCEGLGGATALTLRFPDQETAYKYRLHYCVSMAGHKECPLYKALMAKYEEEDQS